MLIINAEVRVGDGAIAPVKQAIATMEIESRKEPGCQVYAFSVDVNDHNMLRITERWDSMADLEAHFGMPHMAAFSQALARAEILSMEVKAFEVAAEVALPGSEA